MSVRSFARAANPVVALGVAIVLVGGTGAATAASGGSFIIGRSNSATTVTGLTNTNGTALSLAAKSGTPPLAVNNSTKVTRLNADYVDGVDSAALQRRVTGTCTGGAIRSIAASGAVSCAALPGRLNVSVPIGTAFVGTLGGVNVNVSCERVEEFEGPRLFAYLYFTGPAGTLVNGHQWTSLYSDVHTWGPVGIEAPASGTGGKLPTIEAPELAFSRQTATLMVTNGNAVSSLTLHLMADARALAGNPCTVVGTAV
ncbi:MAG TPA: hypothetical protein VNA20_18800 [Frankiaceae bacterium]|nr:hypothetical protein [Frankiaceae bacterium]